MGARITPSASSAPTINSQNRAGSRKKVATGHNTTPTMLSAREAASTPASQANWTRADLWRSQNSSHGKTR